MQQLLLVKQLALIMHAWIIHKPGLYIHHSIKAGLDLQTQIQGRWYSSNLRLAKAALAVKQIGRLGCFNARAFVNLVSSPCSDNVSQCCL